MVGGCDWALGGRYAGVETTNFREDTGLYGGDENLYLIERFTPLESGDLLYDFTVQDDTAWTQPWSGATSGIASRLRFMNTPVTKGITPWEIFCVGPDCWKAKLKLLGINHRVSSDI